MMKILGFTSIRSEYDLMSSLYSLLHNDNAIELKLLVAGAHNAPSFGMTVKDIEADGFDILQVESLIDGDTSSSRLKSASLLLMSSIDIIKVFSPDLILFAGDREEVLIGAMLGGYMGIPTVHFFGGDHATDGHIDNPVRHAASKLSTFHFVSTNEHARRLQALGEHSARIYNIGSVALDKFVEIKENHQIVQEIAKKKIKKKIALYIFHPVENEISRINEIVHDTVMAVIEAGFHVFIGLPNSDHGNSIVKHEITKLSFLDNVTIYGNLPRVSFVQLFKAASLIIGNSSAGLLEAASIPIPCINVGERQKGRACGENVIFVDSEKVLIKEALEKIKTKEFSDRVSKMTNPYGIGNASKSAYELIKKLDFHHSLRKKEDPLDHE